MVAIGPVAVPDGLLPGPQDNPRIDEDPVRCADPATSADAFSHLVSAPKARVTRHDLQVAPDSAREAAGRWAPAASPNAGLRWGPG